MDVRNFTCIVCFFWVAIPLPAHAEMIHDSFDQPHDYITQGVAGTVWDGFVGLEEGQTVTELNASQTATGQLYMASADSRWEPVWNPLGPFLYINTLGDFTATVRVINASSQSWNCAGLMARVADVGAAGSGEDFEAMEYFQAINQLMARTVNNGSETEFGLTSPLTAYLRLRKVDNLFYHEYSNDGVHWTAVNGSPKTRDDMADAPLQVGIAHATYSSNPGFFQFDDFTLEIQDPVYEARLTTPANGEEDVLRDAELAWIPGESATPTGGHDLYMGLNYEDVLAASRSSHANVDYYNLDPNTFHPGTLQPGTTYYWRVDEINLPDIWTGEVWSFTIQDTQAGKPSPAEGAAGVDILTMLNWQNGLEADRHDIFFGDVYADVLNAQKLVGDIDFDRNVDFDDLMILAEQWLDGPCSGVICSNIYPGNDVNLKDFGLLTESWLSSVSDLYRTSQPAGENRFYPGLLSPAKTYYWRIDEFDYEQNGLTQGDVWSFTTSEGGPVDIANTYFDLTFDMTEGGFSRLERMGDGFETNFLSTPGWLLGDIETTYRIGTESWRQASTHASDDNRNVAFSMDGDRLIIDITYPAPSALAQGIKDFVVRQQWTLDGNNLTLQVTIVNTTGSTLELGDLAIPLPFNSDYGGLDTDTIQNKRVIRHGFFSGHASHAYWSRVNGLPAYLVMTTPSPDTRFEYWDSINSTDAQFKAYIYSGVTGQATSGNWRQLHTTRTLSPDESLELRFNFSWADCLSEVREKLYQDDIDIECVPGMTIPQDLYALVKLRTKQTIDSVTAEYPAQTTIQYLGETESGTHLYKIQFFRLGENIISVNHNGTEQTILEFYSCQPLETLYKKRSTHMVNYEQVVNPGVWYDGLFGEWDMRTGVLRTPDNTDGMDLPWWIYVICCDDPGNAHAPFLAGKNVRFPVQSEIDALEYYIDNYLWGGMQYTDTEAYPYCILGVPTWDYNRTNEPTHYWRVFDYPHIVMLYYHMYEIAKYYPDMVSSLDKDGYLNRTYQTAMRYFEVGDGWGYVVGTYNEVVFVDLIKSLRQEGWNTEADALEARWDQKVKYFIFDKDYPYGSEYAMDSTAFESTHALVKWAMETGLSPDPEHPVIDPAQIEEFMQGQMAANLAVRGCIEPAFYTYGSDYRVWGQTRYTLSYMSQMGGWSVLDYGLQWADDPIDYIKLGYGSYLSSWALMNTDPTGSNGYWYPSAANDGAIGWAFKPEKNGPIWLQGRSLDRGIWYYNGEIDLGLCGALRMARSIVVDDPVFGLFGLGCDAALNGNDYEIVLKDGLREWLILQNLGIELNLNRDAFAAGTVVAVNQNKDSINFTLENERSRAHTTTLNLTGLVAGVYSVRIDNMEQYAVAVNDPDETHQLALELGTNSTYSISITKK